MNEGDFAPGVAYRIMPPVHYFADQCASLFYAQALARLKPDVVVVFFAGHGEALGLTLASVITKSAVVFSVGYPIELVPHRFAEFRQFGLDGRLGAIVVLGRHMAPGVERFFGRSVAILPNGVDIEAFRPGDARVQARYGDVPELITVAAAERRKGFDLVLDAMPGVMEQVGRVHYTIVGDGPDRDWLQDQVRQRRLEEYVSLNGAVDDVKPYLARADIFLLPSYGEGLPNAYLEALAMGLPTIVSNDPPYDDIARTEFSIRINRAQPEAMEQAIVDLLRDPVRRLAMGQAARHEAESTYAWRKVAKRYEALFRELVEKRDSCEF